MVIFIFNKSRIRTIDIFSGEYPFFICLLHVGPFKFQGYKRYPVNSIRR